jgi:ring-1,2-phenylacetyl-CoA epoxidase subunit PaaB
MAAVGGVRAGRARSQPRARRVSARARRRDLYTRRGEGTSIWVVPADAITTSDPDAKGAFFESPAGKNYRHASYYTASEGVPHL